jgi:hypothetical protein
MTDHHDPRSLDEARQWVIDNSEDGCDCPCCGGRVKVYPRKLYRTIARGLCVAWSLHRRQWFSPRKSRVPGHDSDFTKLAYWGLIERATTDRDPDAEANGLWRITDAGQAFVQDASRVPSHALILQNRALALDPRRGELSIRDALGEEFDYDELMGRSGPTDEPLSG